MMRRFARRRRGSGRSAAAPIDTASVLQRMLEQRIVPAENLEAYEAEEVPPGFAALGRGEAKTGGQTLVAFSPRHASHALLAALAVGGRLAEAESFSGEVYVVAPDWVGAGRRLLGLIGKLPYRVIAVAAPGLAEDGAAVSPESRAAGAALSQSQIAGHLARPADRDLFLRAARGLEGLAAKHGGALRGSGRSLIQPPSR